MKRLVLFDIDGTLITTNGIARRHFIDTVEELFSIKTTAHAHEFAGKMDPQIYHEILELAGIPDVEIWMKFEEFSDLFYTSLAPDLTASSVQILPGIEILLEALIGDSDITVGLLTGNLEQGARLKLEAVGLNRYFSFGAFGSDGFHRQELPAIAVERALEKTGYYFKEKEIVIIGDTPNDIHCGLEIGVKAIAVSTGKYNHETLAKCNPDYLFRTLESTQEILEAICS